MKSTRRILAVEDETAVAQFLALILCGPNCKVTTACDGREGLAKIEAADEPFDVVFTDHRMPNMNGLEFVRALRAREFTGKIAVLSAHLTEPTVHAYEELHVDLMLSKPFEIDELRGAVERLTSDSAAFASHPSH